MHICQIWVYPISCGWVLEGISVILTKNQISFDFMYIEILPTITKLVISPYPPISQQLSDAKKLSFGGI